MNPTLTVSLQCFSLCLAISCNTVVHLCGLKIQSLYLFYRHFAWFIRRRTCNKVVISKGCSPHLTRSGQPRPGPVGPTEYHAIGDSALSEPDCITAGRMPQPGPRARSGAQQATAELLGVSRHYNIGRRPDMVRGLRMGCGSYVPALAPHSATGFRRDGVTVCLQSSPQVTG